MKEQQNAIECTNCKKWTHLDCTRLTKKEFRTHSENKKATWHCTKCAVLKNTNATNIKIKIRGNKDTGISSKAMSIMNSLVNDIFDKVDNSENKLYLI